MHTLSTTSLGFLVVSAVGCAAESRSDTDSDLYNDTDGVLEVDHEPETPPSLSAQVSFTQGCDDRLVAFDARVLVDGAESSNVVCTFAFDDGQSAVGCRGEHVFEFAGLHTAVLSVRDLGSGTGAQFEERVLVYEPFTLSMEVAAPECGLSFTVRPRFEPAMDDLVLVVTPVENVIRQDGLPLGVVTVDVSAPGTYGVLVSASDERGELTCSKTVEQTITVAECHEHTPECEH
jgi:hypothetical protein